MKHVWKFGKARNCVGKREIAWESEKLRGKARNCVGKREIAWEHEQEVQEIAHTFECLPIGTSFSLLLNNLLKTKSK